MNNYSKIHQNTLKYMVLCSVKKAYPFFFLDLAPLLLLLFLDYIKYIHTYIQLQISKLFFYTYLSYRGACGVCSHVLQFMKTSNATFKSSITFSKSFVTLHVMDVFLLEKYRKLGVCEI